MTSTLAKKLDDTAMQLSAEAFAAARTVYAVTKAPYAKAALRTASEPVPVPAATPAS